jgi:hypothetical protein
MRARLGDEGPGGLLDDEEAGKRLRGLSRQILEEGSLELVEADANIPKAALPLETLARHLLRLDGRKENIPRRKDEEDEHAEDVCKHLHAEGIPEVLLPAPPSRPKGAGARADRVTPVSTEAEV